MSTLKVNNLEAFSGEGIFIKNPITISGSITFLNSGSINNASSGSISYTGSTSYSGSTIFTGTTIFSGSVYISGSDTFYNTGPAVLSGSLVNGIGPFFVSKHAHAEGIQTSASGLYSHAEGNNTKSTGLFSHAEGSQTISSGTASHAEGVQTIASGDYSHAEGNLTVASGYSSHAEGLYTLANSNYAHAEGYATSASAQYSHTEGNNTIALGEYQHVQGQYNLTSTTSASFIIGNGTSNINRKNLVFAAGGDFQITGSLRVDGAAYIQGLTTTAQSNVVTINPSTGQLYYGSTSSLSFTSASYAATASYAQVSLQQVLDYNHDLVNGNNYQGTNAGVGNFGTIP